MNNLNDGLAWGLFPVLFISAGMTIGQAGSWSPSTPRCEIRTTGQGCSVRPLGRRHLITAGMVVQAAALALVATSQTFTPWAIAAVALGAGTAMVYPTLLASIGDVDHPNWRARAVGVYRLWRDLGFVVGALLTGLLADVFGIR